MAPNVQSILCLDNNAALTTIFPENFRDAWNPQSERKCRKGTITSAIKNLHDQNPNFENGIKIGIWLTLTEMQFKVPFPKK